MATYTFDAYDASGKRYSICFHSMTVDVTHQQSEEPEFKNVGGYLECNGHKCNRLDKGKYLILGGVKPIEVVSTDPLAP